jgi:hypothetical protein
MGNLRDNDKVIKTFHKRNVHLFENLNFLYNLQFFIYNVEGVFTFIFLFLTQVFKLVG